MRHDPLVLATLSAFLQRIADYVRTGHRAWVCGEVPLSRAAALAHKFDRLYGVSHTRSQRAWARSQGLGNAVLLLYCPRSELPPGLARVLPSTAHPGPSTAQGEPPSGRAEPMLRWVLLVSGAEHAAHRLERLSVVDGKAGRLVMGDLELVRLPRTGQSQPAWTWRFTEQAYKAHRALVIDVARRTPAALASLVADLALTPGFAGCRTQVKSLLRLAAGEHQRRCSGSAVLTLPRVRYAQRLSSGNLRLSRLRAAYTAQASRAANTGVTEPATEP